MKKMFNAALSGVLFTCSWFAVASDEQELLNVEVDKRAAQIDQHYGVLLTGQERNDLKLSLVVALSHKQ